KTSAHALSICVAQTERALVLCLSNSSLLLQARHECCSCKAKKRSAATNRFGRHPPLWTGWCALRSYRRGQRQPRPHSRTGHRRGNLLSAGERARGPAPLMFAIAFELTAETGASSPERGVAGVQRYPADIG